MRTKLTVFATVALINLIHSSMALAQQSAQPSVPQQPPWGWPGPWHMWYGGWGFWWICPLIMFFIIIAGAAIFLFGRRSTGHGHWGAPWLASGPTEHGGGDPTYSALRILNERYARGEIEKQEFEEKKTAILSSRQR